MDAATDLVRETVPPHPDASAVGNADRRSQDGMRPRALGTPE
jgi:hypothetical protein